MNSAIQLRANESVLFEGNISNVKSLVNAKEGGGTVTNQRCAFHWGGQAFAAEKEELVSVVEQKHGFGTKMILQHKNGENIALMAANTLGLKNALYALVGKAFDEAAVTQPDLSTVKNGTAWLAAAGPLLAGAIVLSIGAMFNWNWDDATTLQLLKVLLFKLVLMYAFVRIDYSYLQQQGFNTNALGIVSPEKLPIYLFSRANAFGHGKGYAITWCVLFALELVPWLF